MNCTPPTEPNSSTDCLPAPAAGLLRARNLFKKHENLLWWLHSGYALLLGTFVMWLGSRDFTYLRIAVFHIAFIWLSSLFLPSLARSRRLSSRWQQRLHLIVNYFNKNFYQQVLFFLLPVYYASTTFGSRNMAFVMMLGVSAALSTLDIVYDRYLSAGRSLGALFFAFNLFACINVMLPVLRSISNSRALWISAGLAVLSFASMFRSTSRLRRGKAFLLAAAAALLFGSVYFLRPFIPPAPLTLAAVTFGESVEDLRVASPLAALPPKATGRIAALTAIKAPMGLREDVRHLWFLDGQLLYASPYHTVTGGRNRGYRLWTHITWRGNPGGKTLILYVETRGGQLIGRAALRPGRR